MIDIIKKFINYFTDGRLSQNEQILWGLTFGVIVLMLALVIIQSIRVRKVRKLNKLNAENEAKYEEEMASEIESEQEIVEEVKEEIHLKYLPIVAAEFGEVTHAIAQACPCEFVQAAKATINDFKEDNGILFVVNAVRELTREEIAEVRDHAEAENFAKENLLVAFDANEYLADPTAFEAKIALVKEHGFACALTNMGLIIDHNALVDFDFVTINRSFKEKYQNDSENMLHILAGGNAIKAIEVDSNEDVANIAQMGFFGPNSECELPYFYSNEIYKPICAECLKIFKSISQLPYLLPEEAYIDYSEVEVEETQETPVVEETPVIEDTPAVLEVEETQEEVQEEVQEEAEEEVQEEFDFDNIKTKPFAVKMVNTTEENKAWYNELKNALLKYEKVRPQYSKGGDGFKYKNKACAKIRLAGKTLRLYLDLNPLGYPQTKYHQKDVSDVKKYIRTPFMVKVKSDLALRRAIFLIDDMARIYAMNQIEGYENEDHMPEMERIASLWEATHPEL